MRVMTEGKKGDFDRNTLASLDSLNPQVFKLKYEPL